MSTKTSRTWPRCESFAVYECIELTWNTLTVDNRCEHGGLAANKRRRLVITHEAWKSIRRWYTEGLEFQVSSNPFYVYKSSSSNQHLKIYMSVFALAVILQQHMYQEGAGTCLICEETNLSVKSQLKLAKNMRKCQVRFDHNENFCETRFEWSNNRMYLRSVSIAKCLEYLWVWRLFSPQSDRCFVWITYVDTDSWHEVCIFTRCFLVFYSLFICAACIVLILQMETGKNAANENIVQSQIWISKFAFPKSVTK